MTLQEPDLVVRLKGSGWHAELVVDPPVSAEPRTVQFNVPDPGAPDGMRLISTGVRYTEAHSRQASHWQRWHVKIYRCDDRTDTEALRYYLRQQASDVQGANADLPGEEDRAPIEPPWAVVPVHIVNTDGSTEILDGTVQTELELAPEDLLRQVRGVYPSWFGDDVPTPDLYLLAVSPWMKQLNWAPFLARPAVQQLNDFIGMGSGLDALHRRGMVHCDIKPDNVCRYSTANSSGFVLIDIDAATRLNPPPAKLRLTPAWAYGRVLHGQRSAQVLRAHDRFGFALVVLCTLAGREWVEKTLLTDLGGGRRAADERDEVRSALRRRWQNTAELRWDPLIEAAVEPFGREIEHLDWSAFQWVNRLIDAERACVVRRPGPPEQPRTPRSEAMRRELDGIRHSALALPGPLPARVRHGYETVRRRAWELAVLRALVTSAAYAAAVVAVVLVLVVIGFGMGG
ncbi:hypothetical protein ACQP1P_33455 [Dactylosporangium sp. CA-052675]|uniref:hypothetical protein n=1 Tax=Dactylosporangium sp. CA-052675 TaxID=3239927 RepID=UPI003D949284